MTFDHVYVTDSIIVDVSTYSNVITRRRVHEHTSDATLICELHTHTHTHTQARMDTHHEVRVGADGLVLAANGHEPTQLQVRTLLHHIAAQIHTHLRGTAMLAWGGGGERGFKITGFIVYFHVHIGQRSFIHILYIIIF